jgi:hypothetical protein
MTDLAAAIVEQMAHCTTRALGGDQWRHPANHLADQAAAAIRDDITKLVEVPDAPSVVAGVLLGLQTMVAAADGPLPVPAHCVAAVVLLVDAINAMPATT